MRAYTLAALAVTAFANGAVAAPPKGTPPAQQHGLDQPLDRVKIPPPGSPPAVKLPAPRRFRFASGAELLIVPRRTLPMVAVAVVWRGGAGADPAGREGLAALTANLLDEGTAKRGPLALAAELQGLGTSLESGCGWDSTAVSMVTLKKNLDASLLLLADVVLHPAFDAKEFDRVKADQIATAEQRKDSAQIVATDAFSEAVYGPLGYGLPATGTAESIARITRGDVTRYFVDELAIGRAVIIMVGDVSAEEVAGSIERLFGVRELAPLAAAEALVKQKQPPPPRRMVIDKPGAPQSEVRIGLPGPPRTTPDYFPLLVMNEILGGGDFSNRLNLNLREAHAYTYGAHSGFGFHRHGGAFVVATAAKTAVTGPAIGEALGELRRIRDAAVKPEELRFAKDSLQRSLARRFETLQDLVFEVAAREVFGLPDDYFTIFAPSVEAVTADDVLRVARLHLDLAQLSIVIVGDRAAIAPQLAGLKAGAFEGIAAPPAGKATAVPAR